MAKLAPLLLALVLAGFAGCLDATGEDGVTGKNTYTKANGLVMGTMPDGMDARNYIDSYIMTHPFRVPDAQFSSFMEPARDDLEAILVGFDYDVQRHDYSSGVNILAFKNGTVNPDQWVVLSAHYDSVGVGGLGPTVYGAWDDGAGTALLIEMAESYRDWEFPFTVVFAFFDGEEKGLQGSKAFVADYFQEGTQDILANLNTDPPGLNYPCGDPLGDFPVKLIEDLPKVDAGAYPRFQWLNSALATAFAAAEVPERVVDRSPGIPIATATGTGVTGSSDHASFGAVNIANVFIGGTPTTYVGGGPSDGGLAAALTYPLHTPLDTLEAMEARCLVGSLAGGLQTVADIFTQTLIALASTPAPVFDAAIDQ